MVFNSYAGIEQVHKVLLICTPKLKQRAAEQKAERNNLQLELDTALAKAKTTPNFIVPIIMSGRYAGNYVMGLVWKSVMCLSRSVSCFLILTRSLSLSFSHSL